ncbi:hypothetical protein [Gluconobacter albidus]|uniref:Glycine zipper domain-containing protein n=1 Tax=Gluconobacter albidus TaxID=318683 RepID=A0AAW3QSR1_9PROT|nr:hypothetical protein [Gluconobacter albidus]KXV36654.1 hypothetical protein AD941_15100 [Gluconobacter albidus]GBQ91507.1 hypothetical protein AA3250_2293 [Gluconobacter albidus NBRC 3250]GLQ68415.1 hypothetical protein GCM10007866_08630 [Gluconobacter albidus]
MRTAFSHTGLRCTALVGAFATIMALGGCEGNYDPGSRALGGGLLGGGTGAAIGALAGGGRGAAIGALAGGVLGAGAGAVTTPNRPGYQSGYSNGQQQGYYNNQQGTYPQQQGQYMQPQYQCPPNINCQQPQYPNGYPNNSYPPNSGYSQQSGYQQQPQNYQGGYGY